jgi:hypothetical protein
MGILNVVFVIAIVVAFAMVGTAMGRKRLEKMKASNKTFLEKYPDAARVYPYSRSAIVSEAVRIHTVDGEFPEFFYDDPGKVSGVASIIAGITGNGSTSGFYLKPGTSTVEMSYYHNRPGIFYKNVTSTTDVIKKDLAVEANKKYLLGFNQNEKTFTLEETNS